MFTITGLAVEPLTHILRHLCEADIVENRALQGGYEPENFAKWIMEVDAQAGVYAFLAWHEGEPVGILSAHALTPKCVNIWGFGTSNWRRVIRPVTRHVKTIMIPLLLELGYHRAECRVLASRLDTRRWLAYLGFRPEAVLSEFGIRREDFLLFAWISNELHGAPLPDPKEHSELVRVPLRLH